MMTTERETEQDTPRIYVASLSDYNAGRLHGVWIDCDQTADEIGDEVQEMLARSTEPGAEEYAIHDHENWSGLPIGEWTTLEQIAEWAELLTEHGPAFAAYMLNDPTAEDFEESYQGEWRSEQDYAQDLAEDMGDLPTEYHWPRSYIDWDTATRDLFSGDYWSAEAAGGGVYVFRSA